MRETEGKERRGGADMSSFTFISVIALFCYVFLFMTMLAARKSRMINAFLLCWSP